MKKFDFSKEFGNIDSKYISEAEEEWKGKKNIWTPTFLSRAAAACVIVALGSVIFSNPKVQAAMKNLTLSIEETLGFPKSIASYTEVLNTSQTDKGITVTLKEVVLDDGVLLAKVHAEKTDSNQEELTFANTQIAIDDQKTTINGQKLNEYGSGSYLPYSEEDLLNTGLDENVYDAVLESRFTIDGDLGENPEVHLVLGAYRDENLSEDYLADFAFDFSISHGELMKQTVHKKLEDISIETDEGTIKLTDFSMNKLQSTITAEIPEELQEKLYNNYEMILHGTDSKGNQVQYELSHEPGDESSQWSFKTSFWGMYQLDSDGPVILLPDIDCDYLELQLYVREHCMAADEDIIFDDGTVLTTDDPVETAIIGGADAPTEIEIQDNIEPKENADDEDDELYGTEESDDWKEAGIEDGADYGIAVGNQIKIQIK